MISILFISTTITGQNFIPNGEYIIISAQNEKVLDVSGAKKDNGTNITVWDFNGQDNQKFNLEFADNGELIINSKHSGKNLDVAQGSKQDLANIQLWEINNSPAQKFRLETVENTDMFMIVNVNSDKAITLDPNSGNVFQMSKPAADGKQGGNLNQCWRFAQRLTFQNESSKKKLDVQGGLKTAGTKLQIYDSNNSKAQAYDLIPVVNSNDFYLRNINSLKYLTVTDNNNAPGVVIEQNDFNIMALQKFETDKVSEYTYYLKPTGSSFVLGVQNNSNVNGAYVMLADKQSTASQHWKFYNYDPKSASQHAKEELKDAGKKAVDNVKDAGKKAVDNVKDAGKKAKDKLKGLFKK
jgi:hypothetical protein